MSRFSNDPDEAEEALLQANDALWEAERDLAIAEAVAEAIEQEDFSTPEEEAELSARMEIVQSEIRGLEEDLSDAAQEHSIAFDRWKDMHGLV